MPWFKVDGNLASHIKVSAAGNAAIGLWTRAGSWSAENFQDGYVPTHIVKSYGTIAQARKLVEAGLWVEADGGYRFHEWEQRQPAAQWWKDRRDADRTRKRDSRSGQSPPGVRADTARNPQQNPQGIPTDSERIPQHVRSAPNPNPTPKGSGEGEGLTTGGGEVPLPQRFSGRETQVTRAREATANGEPSRRCDRHRDVAGDVPPCGACGEARHANEAWKRQRDAAERAARERGPVVGVSCPEHPDQPAGRCGRCASEHVGPPPNWRHAS